MKSNKKSGLIVLIIVIVVAILCCIGNFSGINISENTTKKTVKSIHNDYIASLYIEGTIQKENDSYNQEWLLGTIKHLKEDKNNKAIAVFINSPGGTVYEADEAYLALEDYKTAGKPVYVYQANMAASGGYYISCAGEKIYANRNTLTGSIGVITGSSVDITGFLHNLGIKSETIHSGKNKNMFSLTEPVTEEQRKIMQSISDECYEQFTSIVAARRNLPLADVKKLADGRIYTANQALNNGLIDKIDSFENMINDLQNDKFEEKKLNVVDFKYNRDKNLKDILFGKTKSQDRIAEFLENITAQSNIQYPAYLYQ